MTVFLWCLLAAGADWQTTETGVFQPLRPDEVVVRPDGGFYVKNFNDSQVRFFNGEGKLVKTIGRKGKGPGEFTYPVSIFFENDRLYVFDVLTTKVSAFNAAGEYIDSATAPNRGLRLHKVQGGWVYGDWGSLGRPEKPAFYWTDSAFKEKETLETLQDAGFSQGSMVWSDGTKTLAEFSPIDNRPIIAVSPDGKLIYFTSIETFKITVFDAGTRKVIRTITREEPRVPFDEEWAEEKYKEAIADDRQKHDYKKNYPEYFPPMRSILVAYDGSLIVDRWRGRPDKNHHPIALSPEGKELKMQHSYDTYARMAGVWKDQAYLLIFNADDEEAGVARCAIKDADAFVKANPIVFEGSAGYSISISE